MISFQGTNGGVTVVGLISTLLGGLVIGAAYYLGIFMAASQVGFGIIILILVGCLFFI